MSRLLESTEAEVTVARRLVGIMDGGADMHQGIRIDSWLNVGDSRFFLRTQEDALNATARFESWDGPAVFDEQGWQRHDELELLMPTGQIFADSIDAGISHQLFCLPEPGRYRVRLAVQEEPGPPVAEDTPDWEWPEPQVTILLQFWPA